MCGGYQLARIVSPRPVEQLLGGLQFQQGAGFHYTDGMRHQGGHRQVVRDKEHGKLKMVLQIQQQAQYFALSDRIHRAGGFVRNHQLGMNAQRHHQQHPLAHAAGQLMRILGPHLPLCQTDLLQQFLRSQRAGLAIVAGAKTDHIQHLLADGAMGQQSGLRILKDKTDMTAPQLPQRRLLQIVHRLVVYDDLS
ncbi:MAG: hypothetical protein BWY83_03060 [bacterium ADurb.Bin478]|nr:MAG: hypothetical protein BWY83_03060 [bacterium ADurb.Bin478]